jgi:hypothetical protein
LGTCSKDPIGYEGSRWNLYGYVKGSPILYLDPTGLKLIVKGDAEFQKKVEGLLGELCPDGGMKVTGGVVSGKPGFFDQRIITLPPLPPSSPACPMTPWMRNDIGVWPDSTTPISCGCLNNAVNGTNPIEIIPYRPKWDESVLSFNWNGRQTEVFHG